MPADIGNTTSGSALFQLRYSGSAPYTTLEAVYYTASTNDGTVSLISPDGDSHAALRTYMLRWDGLDMDVTMEDVTTRDSGTRGSEAAFGDANFIHLGADRSGSNFSNATVESAVVYDDWLTDAEFTAIANLPRAWSWDMLPVAAAATAAATYSYPEPTMHLTPAASEDTEGDVTVSTSGTVTTVAGTYGDAWDMSAGGGIYVPLVAHNQRIRADRGTILIRATLGAPTGSHRTLFEIGDTVDTGFGFLRARYPSTVPSSLVLDWYNAATASGKVVLESPHGDTHTLLTYMARWEGETMALGIGSSDAITTGSRAGVVPFNVSGKFAWFGSARTASSRWMANIEDVLVLDRAITDAEFDIAATWPEAWSWRML